MPPRFDARGHQPPGIPPFGRSEFKAAFGYNDRRRAPVAGMRMAPLSLKRAGRPTAYIDGSFVSQKPDPGDYDGCWDRASVDGCPVDPALPDTSGKTCPQKWTYGGEMSPVRPGADDSALGHSRCDRDGGAKGIAMTCLGGLDD